MSTTTRYYEARLVHGDMVYTLMRIIKPFPKTIRWRPPPRADFGFILRPPSLGLQVPDLDEIWEFRFEGVEVDMTGTWVHYARLIGL